MTRRNLAWLLACLVAVPAVLHAETGQSPPAPTTMVYVAAVVIDIDEIDSAEQNFVANLALRLRWHDPRLADSGAPEKRRFPLDEVWHPGMLFVNQQKIWPSLEPEVAVTPGGDVTYLQRVWGPVSQPLDVRDFPFDSQEFEIRLASVRSLAREVTFRRDKEARSVPETAKSSLARPETCMGASKRRFSLWTRQPDSGILMTYESPASGRSSGAYARAARKAIAYQSDGIAA